MLCYWSLTSRPVPTPNPTRHLSAVAIWGCRSRKERRRGSFRRWVSGRVSDDLGVGRRSIHTTVSTGGIAVEILIQIPPWPLSDKAVSRTTCPKGQPFDGDAKLARVR